MFIPTFFIDDNMLNAEVKLCAIEATKRNWNWSLQVSSSSHLNQKVTFLNRFSGMCLNALSWEKRDCLFSAWKYRWHLEVMFRLNLFQIYFKTPLKSALSLCSVMRGGERKLKYSNTFIQKKKRGGGREVKYFRNFFKNSS